MIWQQLGNPPPHCKPLWIKDHRRRDALHHSNRQQNPLLLGALVPRTDAVGVSGRNHLLEVAKDVASDLTAIQKMQKDFLLVDKRYAIVQDKVLEGGFGSVFVASSKRNDASVGPMDVAIKYCPIGDDLSTTVMIDRESRGIDTIPGRHRHCTAS